ncbi:hypothetical protein FB45DRAFT_1013820 [Roridomyces roridus]|uniref:Uncharacterized protein n=1 Tax=Roridomyces roridus TaxID=1738132 RepID=A0AAD7F622_9AGAR|nr:hypothetical protein FB45DRAFT_1013820 [Roridomyces roridus]
MLSAMTSPTVKTRTFTMAELNEGSTPLITNLNYEVKSPTFTMAELNEGSIPFKPRPIGFGRPPRPILYLRKRRVSLTTLLPKDDLEAPPSGTPSTPTPIATPIHHSRDSMNHWCEHCEFMPWPLNPFIPSFEPVIFDWVVAPAFSNTISSVGAFPTSCHYIQYIFCKRYIKYQTVVLQKLPGSARHPGAVSGILDNQVNSRSGDD